MNYSHIKSFEEVKKLGMVIVATVVILGFLFYFIAGSGIHYGHSSTDMVTASYGTEILVQGVEVTQRFQVKSDRLDGFYFLMGTYSRENDDNLQVSVKNSDGVVLSKGICNTLKVCDREPVYVALDNPVSGYKNEYLTVSIESERGSQDNAVSLYYGDSVQASRYQIGIDTETADRLIFDGKQLPGKLCLSVAGTDFFLMGRYYWWGYLAIVSMTVLLCGNMAKKYRRGEKSTGLTIYNNIIRYKFLLKQLVNREFKSKYKRSILGIFWSFLNPLLTMMVQYVVFSTLFKSSTPNYPVYLLSGIIIFNFFSDTSNACMTSIVGNASLINKVYVPKAIYPLSKALNACLNLLLSFIPLIIVALLTGVKFTPKIILVLFDFICLFGFSVGMGMILATGMVFFRDVQFLWGVISLLWIYLTPIFYTVSIIPEGYRGIYMMNPMYIYIDFLRVIVIDGISPVPLAYLKCLLYALVLLGIGIRLFTKYENDFILKA